MTTQEQLNTLNHLPILNIRNVAVIDARKVCMQDIGYPFTGYTKPVLFDVSIRSKEELKELVKPQQHTSGGKKDKVPHVANTRIVIVNNNSPIVSQFVSETMGRVKINLHKRTCHGTLPTNDTLDDLITKFNI